MVVRTVLSLSTPASIIGEVQQISSSLLYICVNTVIPSVCVCVCGWVSVCVVWCVYESSLILIPAFFDAFLN